MCWNFCRWLSNDHSGAIHSKHNPHTTTNAPQCASGCVSMAVDAVLLLVNYTCWRLVKLMQRYWAPNSCVLNGCWTKLSLIYKSVTYTHIKGNNCSYSITFKVENHGPRMAPYSWFRCSDSLSATESISGLRDENENQTTSIASVECSVCCARDTLSSICKKLW